MYNKNYGNKPRVYDYNKAVDEVVNPERKGMFRALRWNDDSSENISGDGIPLIGDVVQVSEGITKKFLLICQDGNWYVYQAFNNKRKDAWKLLGSDRTSFNCKKIANKENIDDYDRLDRKLKYWSERFPKKKDIPYAPF